MSFANFFDPNKLSAAFSDPRVQLGLQMLAAGGYQQGNPGFGQRFAQAGQGFAQQQLEQQQLAQLNQLRQLQTQRLQQESTSAQQLAERMRDPAFAATLPEHSRRLAEAGATPKQIFEVYRLESQVENMRSRAAALEQHRAAQLAQQQPLIDARTAAANRSNQGNGAQGPKPPAMRQTIDQPLANGMVQRHIYNPDAGGYVPFGEPFQRSQAQGADPLSQLLGEIPTGAPKAAVPGTTAGQLPPADVPMPQAGPALPPGVEAAGGMAYRGDVPMPHLDTQPYAAAGGGQRQAQQARSPIGSAIAGDLSGYEQDLAQAQRLLQANPALRDEINRRLVQKYGRGL